MSTLTARWQATIPGQRARAQRPCTLPRCGGTAEHTYTLGSTAWFRCTCGIEFPESARVRAA